MVKADKAETAIAEAEAKVKAFNQADAEYDRCYDEMIEALTDAQEAGAGPTELCRITGWSWHKYRVHTLGLD